MVELAVSITANYYIGNRYDSIASMEYVHKISTGKVVRKSCIGCRARTQMLYIIGSIDRRLEAHQEK